MVLTQSCGLTTVAMFLADLLGTTYGAQRQQLREWCYDAPDQRGKGRREVDVSGCFAPLLGWVLALWPTGERRLALALNATTLGQRFTVLAQRGLSRLCHPGSLAHRAGHGARTLASALGAVAHSGGRRSAGRLAGQRAGGSRSVCPLAVPGDCGAALASLLADQSARAVPSVRQPPVPAPGHGGAAGHAWVERDGGVFRQFLLPAVLHVAGSVDGAPRRSLADSDRSATGGRRHDGHCSATPPAALPPAPAQLFPARSHPHLCHPAERASAPARPLRPPALAEHVPNTPAPTTVYLLIQ